ncbi:DUF1152 domain-containing protein [Kribbella sp. NPDC054772]
MFTLSEPPVFTRLRDARRVLVAGAGGGFDVYAGVPLALALVAQGKEVEFANLSFAELGEVQEWLTPGVAVVRPDSRGRPEYFPERVLSRWLESKDLSSTVYAFPRTGVAPLRAAYEALVGHLGIDAVVLVDGGTDILMRGDEAGLGTPEEDMASLGALSRISGIERLVVCLGFGIDAYHGVNHVDVLENLAALSRTGDYLGAVSIPPASAEAAAYLDLVDYAQLVTPVRPSIVNGQIAAALRGDFGDVQFTARTAGGELLVNPLMALYFAVDLDGLARSVGYLDELEGTEHPAQISRVIERHREGTRLRPRRVFPH